MGILQKINDWAKGRNLKTQEKRVEIEKIIDGRTWRWGIYPKRERVLAINTRDARLLLNDRSIKRGDYLKFNTRSGVEITLRVGFFPLMRKVK